MEKYVRIYGHRAELNNEDPEVVKVESLLLEIYRYPTLKLNGQSLYFRIERNSQIGSDYDVGKQNFLGKDRTYPASSPGKKAITVQSRSQDSKKNSQDPNAYYHDDQGKVWHPVSFHHTKPSVYSNSEYEEATGNISNVEEPGLNKAGGCGSQNLVQSEPVEGDNKSDRLL